MKQPFYFSLTLVFAVMLLSPPVIAQKLILSTYGSTTIGGQSIENSDLVEYDTETKRASLLMDGSAVFTEPNSLLRSIDAAHRLPNGNIVLSSSWHKPIGTVSYDRNDLVEYDPVTGTAKLFLDGETVFTGSYAGYFDAIHVLNDGSIVLSVFSGATIGELDFDGNDIVRYDPSTQKAGVILDLDTIVTGGSLLRDVDALHVLPNGNLVFSTSADLTIGSLSFEDEDLVEYNPNTGSFTPFFNGSDVFPPTDLEVADINAFSLVDDDGDPPPPPPCAGGTITNPINIALNQQLSCELTSTDQKFVSGEHFKVFHLSSPGGQVTFNATSNAFTPRVGLPDPSDPSNTSFFVHPVPYSASNIPTGTSLFLITSTNPGRFGPFSVIVTTNSQSAKGSTTFDAISQQGDFGYRVLPLEDQ